MVSTRLSDEEAAYLDEQRKGMKRGDYLRLLLTHDERRHESGDLAEVSTNPQTMVTIEDPPIEKKELPNLKTVKHLHRQGALIETYYEKGTERKVYHCQEPSCPETIVR